MVQHGAAVASVGIPSKNSNGPVDLVPGPVS